MRKHKFLTKELLAQFARVGEQDIPDPIVVAKYFDPCGSWTWYATAYYPERKEFFGYVEGIENELGYFSLHELEAFKGRFGIGIERDAYFEQCRLSHIRKKG